MDHKLTRAIQRHTIEQLATAAHEIGHALTAQAYGATVKQVRLNFGLFGGLHGGHCDLDWPGSDPGPDWPTDRQIGMLLVYLAGHAADARFRRVYLAAPPRVAYHAGKDDATNDYWHFRKDRKLFRLRLSEDDLFHQAAALLESHATRLDRLTLRLYQQHRIPGAHL